MTTQLTNFEAMLAQVGGSIDWIVANCNLSSYLKKEVNLVNTDLQIIVAPKNHEACHKYVIEKLQENVDKLAGNKAIIISDSVEFSCKMQLLLAAFATLTGIILRITITVKHQFIPDATFGSFEMRKEHFSGDKFKLFYDAE